MNDDSKITRFEVIDENGRAYTRWDVKVEVSIQDGGRTMKIFVHDKNYGVLKNDG